VRHDVRRTIHRFDVVTSTQVEARRLLACGQAKIGDVIVAKRQTVGRGRFGRRWVSPAGGLYGTFIVSRSSGISAQSGVAVLRALGRFGVEARLQWPNDIIVSEKKLAGILIESVGDAALVGIGVNLTEAPLPTATSLGEHAPDVDREELVGVIADELRTYEGKSGWMCAYRRSLCTLGRSVRVRTTDGGTCEGTAVDVDEIGRLIVEVGEETVTISSGDCIHLQSCHLASSPCAGGAHKGRRRKETTWD
jgi:BirA family biotin operon repressor/biotin-[acetyl-CoA-carboxylase] ligase